MMAGNYDDELPSFRSGVCSLTLSQTKLRRQRSYNIPRLGLSDLSLTQATPMKTQLFGKCLGQEFQADELCITNIACLWEENPELCNASTLHTEFHAMWQSCQRDHQILSMLSGFHTLCTDSVKLLGKLAGASQGVEKLGLRDADSLLACLDAERVTWALLFAIYKDRFDADAREEELASMDLADFCYSEREVVHLLYTKDRDLREAQIVVDWLENIMKEQIERGCEREECFIGQSMSWENTFHFLTTKNRSILVTRNMMVHLDPDAPLRGTGKLADEDQENEERFLRFLYACIRAGDLDRAERLCMARGEYWRAATLEGWRPFHNPFLVAPNSLPSPTPTPTGNPSRALYRATVLTLALDPKLSVHERGVYAALVGQLDTLLQVVPSNSWHDLVWAHCRAMVEARVDARMRPLVNNGYRTTQAVTGDLNANSDLLTPACLPPADWTLGEMFLQVETVLGSSPGQELRLSGGGKPLGRSLFCAVQKAAILGDIGGLVDDLHAALQRLLASGNVAGGCGGGLGSLSVVHKHLLRFMAHVVLFCRRIQPGVLHSCEKSAAILESYLSVLISDRNVELVAPYTATLPSSERQIQCYATFLEGVTVREERARCLQLAESAGLDVARITSLVVETIRRRPVAAGEAGQQLMEEDGPVDCISLFPMLTQEDRTKIEAIDWLVFTRQHWPEAVRQANAMVRLFVLVDKLNAAREVMKKLPPETVPSLTDLLNNPSRVPPWLRNALREHECLTLYLQAQDYYADWLEHYHRARPVAPSQPSGRPHGQQFGASFAEKLAAEQVQKVYEADFDKWSHLLRMNTKATADKIEEVLCYASPGWLVDLRLEDEPGNASVDQWPSVGSPSSEAQARGRQLVVLREMCVRQLTTVLIRVLTWAGEEVRCMRVADIIASEDYRLYKLFPKEQLQKLVQLLQEPALKLFEKNMTPLGYKL